MRLQYSNPQPNPRASTQEAHDHLVRGRGSLNVIMSGGGCPSTRVPRVRPEAQEVSDHHQGKGANICLNQDANRGYSSARPGSRVQGDGEDNCHRGRGTMNIILDTDKNMNFNVPRGEPRVKAEAADNATKGKGSMVRVLDQQENMRYSTSRGESRVKPEGEYNASQGQYSTV